MCQQYMLNVEKGIPQNYLGRMVTFYEALPKGPAPKPKVRGPVDWYHQKYMADNESAMRKGVHTSHLHITDAGC